MAKKIKVSEVVRKDLKILAYLIFSGLVTILSNRYLQTGEASVLFGMAANYLVFRLEKELKGEGYRKAIK